MDARIEDTLRGPADSTHPLRLVTPLLVPLLLVPAIVVLREPHNVLAMQCLAAGAVAIAYSVASEALERRMRAGYGVQIGNAIFYAAMISVMLAAFVTTEHVRLHLHGILFFLYLLLIGAVGLSDDPRQAVAAGSVSIIGYCGVVLFAHQAAADGNAVAALLLPQLDWVGNGIKITMLAGASVVAVASAERGRALRRLSLRDGLTGLLNRRAFDDCLTRLARSGDELTVAMIDIDHFKRLNDEHGHAIGDTVLRWVASQIERSFRTGDLVARYGGEEFVVALASTADARIDARLEVLRAHIATSVLRERRSEHELRGVEGVGQEDELPIRTTISIGVARLPADGETPEQVLRRADQRLYEAKAAGRNRVVRGEH